METMRKAIAIQWMARISCIMAILFISLLALEAFSGGNTLLQKTEAFLIHIIPSFVLIAVLILDSRRELAGGIIFTILGAALIPFIYIHNFRMNHSVAMSVGVIAVINLPFIVVGVLFMASHFILHRKKATGQTVNP